MPSRKRQNPYNPNRPASAEMFVGREKLKRQLTDNLVNGTCFELTGAPGIGKTSLLAAVQRELVAKQARSRQGVLPLPIYVECHNGYHRAEDVLAAITHGLAAALNEQRQLLCPPAELNKAQTEAGRGRLEAALTVLLDWAFTREKRTHWPVLLLDDLHRLSSKACLQPLASMLHPLVNQARLGLALVSRQPLTGELHDDVSPLRMLIAHHQQLLPLDRKETQALVAKAAAHGWEVEGGCGDLAYRLTGGHPYRLHYYLFGALSSARKLTVAGLNGLHTPDTLRHLAVFDSEHAPSRSAPPSVFISYSHKDESEKNKLLSHLGVLGKADLAEVWSDDRIGTGADWQRDIEQAMAGAKVAILLVSDNFLNSDFILRAEVPALLRRRASDGLVILPLIAKACAWRKVKWLAEIQVAPKNGTPIWRDDGRHVDEDLAHIAEKIADIVAA